MNDMLVSAPRCVHTSRMRFHSIGIYNDVSGHSVKRLKSQNKKMIIHALRPQECAKHRRDASFCVCTATCAITHPMRGAALCAPHEVHIPTHIPCIVSVLCRTTISLQQSIVITLPCKGEPFVGLFVGCQAACKLRKILFVNQFGHNFQDN